MDLIFLVGILLPVVFLYMRNKDWASIPRRLWIQLALALVGLLSYLSLFTDMINGYGAERVRLSFALVYPLVCTALESIGSSMSQRYQKRDFYLALEKSDDDLNNLAFSLLDFAISYTLFGSFMVLFVILLGGWESLWQ
ncbi:MAG: hypothetical protein AAGM67_14315 [Bacteroidota bacterium]